MHKETMINATLHEFLSCSVFRTEPVFALAQQKLTAAGRSFEMTAGGNMRKVANIDEEELLALMANGDIDALDFAHSGYSDKYALRRLLQKFPRWRCSEGAI